jgi:hypothetical protein
MSATVLKLYDTVDALLIVEEWIYEHEDELRASEGVLPQELADLLAAAQVDFKTKTERVALFIRELLSNAVAVKEEEKRLILRRQHYEKAAEGLKGYLLHELERAGEVKVEGQLATVRVQKSPPAVTCELPQDELAALSLMTTGLITVVPVSYRVNRDGVLEAYKAKHMLPAGIIVSQGTHIRIS